MGAQNFVIFISTKEGWTEIGHGTMVALSVNAVSEVV
jgi:hypothetical protein